MSTLETQQRLCHPVHLQGARGSAQSLLRVAVSCCNEVKVVVLQPLPADPAEAAEVRALRAANKRLAQELDILKKAIAIGML